MHLTKHHGFGNDFLVALDEHAPAPLAVDGALARRLCDRRRGIGADGLIHGAAPGVADREAGIDAVMHLFNSDGSPAEMSGNGVRCLAQAVALGRALDTAVVTVRTDAGVREVVVEPAGVPGRAAVEAEMGIPRDGPPIPAVVQERVGGTAGTVDMGNPHLVVLVAPGELATIDLAGDGAWVEQQFPGGINVEYVAAPVDRGGPVRMRVWERGAGITEACGTGACAVAFLAQRWGLVDGTAEVAMPGGTAHVVVGPAGVRLGGEVELIGAIDVIDAARATEAG